MIGSASDLRTGGISVCAQQSWILLSRALGKVFPSQEIALMFIFVLNENDDLNRYLFFCMTFFFFFLDLVKLL